MADIGVVITGDRIVALRFDQFPQKLHGKLLERITALTENLEARVRASAPRRTGKLESEIVGQVFDAQDKIVGRVAVSGDFAKAAALEYGSRNPTKVEAHAMRLGHVFERKLLAPEMVLVSVYLRRPNIAAQRFLRGPEAEMADQIGTELQEAVTDTVAET